jgi:hypothetical protein
VRGRASIADDDATLLWRIDGLATGDALALAYTLPLWTASVDHGTLELEFTRGVGISIQLSTLPARKRLLRIDNFTADQDALAVVSLGKSPIGPVEIGSRRTLWRLDAGARVWLDLPETS